MTGTGLVDVAASLPHDRRSPAALLPTGRGSGRTDRHYATPELAEAATGYRQLVTGGSDHHLTMTIYDRALLTAAIPPARETEAQGVLDDH
jgi:hypothetical protein